ncbi:MAG: radical SAM protein [Armatimonadota bacterium]
MKKAVFFSPPLDDFWTIPSYNINLLATMASKTANCQVFVFDGVRYYNEKYGPFSVTALSRAAKFLDEVINEIEKYTPDMLFMTSTLYSLPFISEFAKSYKRRNPKTIIILGGIAATAIPGELSRRIPAIDHFVAGEAEYLIIDLINKLSGKTNSLTEKIITNNQDINLDKVPYVDYDYLNRTLSCLYIETSRGCHYECSFCSANTVQKTYRKKSISRVINEIIFYKSKYSTKNFTLIDNNFTNDNVWLREFCIALIEEKLNIFWDCSSRIDALNKKDLYLMKKSGCYSIFIGLESIFLKNLSFCRKNMKTIDLNLIKECQKMGIKPKVSLITGFPGDTEAQINKIFNYASRLEKEGAEAHLSSLAVLPGSALYEKFKKGKMEIFFSDKGLTAKNEIINMFADKYKKFSNFAPYMWFVKNKNLKNSELEKIINNNSKILAGKSNKETEISDFRANYKINQRSKKDFLVIVPAAAKMDYGMTYFPIYFTTRLRAKGVEAVLFSEEYFPGHDEDSARENECLDFYVKTVNDLCSKNVLIYTMISNFPFVIELVKKLKTDSPGLKIILIGEVYKFLSEKNQYILKNADFVMDSFSEESIEKLAYYLKGGHKKIQKTGIKPFLFRGFADYDAILNYNNFKKGIVEINNGCGHNCRFCARTDKKVYLKDPAFAVEYLKYMKKRFSLEEFIFSDSSISADYNWLKKFCSLLIKEKLDIRWNALSRADTVDNYLLGLMKQAGCYLISFGLESANESSLKFLGKARNIKEYMEKSYRNIELSLKNNISVHASLITGLPVETEKEIKNTAKLAGKLNDLGVVVKLELLSVAAGSALWHYWKCGKIQLVEIKNENLKKWVRRVNCSPLFFLDRYSDCPDIAPFSWRIKNEYIPDDYLENLLYEEFRAFAPNKGRSKLMYRRTEASPDGRFKVMENLDFFVKEIRVNAAPRSVKGSAGEMDCSLFVDRKKAQDFKINNDIKFTNTVIVLKSVLDPGRYKVSVVSKSGDNNLFVRFVDFAGEQYICV